VAFGHEQQDHVGRYVGGQAGPHDDPVGKAIECGLEADRRVEQCDSVTWLYAELTGQRRARVTSHVCPVPLPILVDRSRAVESDAYAEPRLRFRRISQDADPIHRSGAERPAAAPPALSAHPAPRTSIRRSFLAQWWSQYTENSEDDNLSAHERIAVTAPYGQQWPGLAAPAPAHRDPGAHADQCAAELLADNPRLRLGLVATARPSDAITVAGWQGAANYTNDTAKLSAVLRSWKKRFGAIIIGAGFAEIYLSIAAPPTTIEHAVNVAAEHFAFCPDNIWQGHSSNLTTYAERLVDTPLWSFWWD
jgi:hypothetical protein